LPPELVRLFTADFRNGGEPSAADRSYIAKVVAARTGLSQADADKRVNDVIVQVKADLDKARKAAMKLAIWLTLSLFIGASRQRWPRPRAEAFATVLGARQH